MQTKSPLWVTPERQAYLVELFNKYGNRCLLGHKVCPIPEHYFYLEYKQGYALRQKHHKFRDGNERPIIGNDGKPLEYDIFIPYKVLLPQVKVARLYEYLSESFIDDWKRDSRQQAAEEYKALHKALHSVPTRLRNRSSFNADNFYDNQPIYYIVGYGVSGITFQPLVRIRLPSSHTQLIVKLPHNIFARSPIISKSLMRKHLRYGKPLPEPADVIINRLCAKAVNNYRERLAS
jgi:hypothetical protein